MKPVRTGLCGTSTKAMAFVEKSTSIHLKRWLSFFLSPFYDCTQLRYWLLPALLRAIPHCFSKRFRESESSNIYVSSQRHPWCASNSFKRHLRGNGRENEWVDLKKRFTLRELPLKFERFIVRFTKRNDIPVSNEREFTREMHKSKIVLNQTRFKSSQ